MITSKHFESAAALLGVEPAVIKAVAEVESGGAGMTVINENQVPVILFEPHIFFQQLQRRGIKPKVSDICYPKWKRDYPPGQRAQHERLQRASAINRDAALCSASWGRFQVMGFNWSSCGCQSLQEFINAMYAGEHEHLRLFCHFIKTKGLDKALQRKDWAAFAKSYNGPSYAENKYDKKMNTAYIKYKAS